MSSVVVLIALGRTWVNATYSESGFPSVSLSLSANQLDSSVNGIAFAAIASALGAIATRGVFRRMVGVVIASLGFGVVFTTVSLIKNLDQFVGLQFEQAIGREVSGWVSETSTLAWPVVAAGFVVAMCGLAIALKSFDGGMSKRYERNAERKSELTPWQAMDQGIDPTIQVTSSEQLD